MLRLTGHILGDADYVPDRHRLHLEVIRNRHVGRVMHRVLIGHVPSAGAALSSENVLRTGIEHTTANTHNDYFRWIH
jgi:hypothetical protein